MSTSPIYLTRDDASRLRLLVNAMLASSFSKSLEKLRTELDRAVVVDANAVPPGLVTMDSHVTFEDISSGEVEDYTIAFPDRANVEQKRLSILAPIGTALIGYREGDEVDWTTPGGVRRLKIRSVKQPTAADTAPTGLMQTESR